MAESMRMAPLHQATCPTPDVAVRPGLFAGPLGRIVEGLRFVDPGCPEFPDGQPD